MVVQNKQSPLMAKYGAGLDRAVQKHAADEVNYGPVRLPGGINNGVAQLKDCGFGVYKTGNYTGEYFFRASGVVIEPYSIMTPSGEMRVARLETSIMVPVCATQNSKGEITPQEEHVATILNEMQKLGGPGFTEGATANDLESLAATLTEAAPYFRFSTSQSAATAEYPNPRVWENWHGNRGMEDYIPPEDVVPGVDEGPPTTKPPVPNGNGAPRSPVKTTPGRPVNRVANAATPSTKMQTRPAAVTTVAKVAGAGKVASATRRQVTPPPQPEPEEEMSPVPDTEFGDIDSLLEGANNDQTESQQALLQMAHDLGIGEDETDKTKSWEEIVEMINTASSSGETPESEEEAEEEITHEPEETSPPLKGNLYIYRPVDPRTKKPSAKGVECVVASVNAAAQTVNLYENDNPKKTYAKVPFDRLENE